ncbi:hypothetical protein FSP39_007228 [Pinctada imbricata]|uniref:DAGKc domain-containing protein n=1 Tax=Pinctada imbricata TaxID=66713 RepID=A0AA88YMY7_PINIB|nr:hypothetical protein FSP39_007228 [Pinctada imbricata]
MAEINDVVYQSSLDINKKPHQVILSKTHLTWEAAVSRTCDGSPSSEPFIANKACRQIPLEELIAVCPEKSLNHSNTPTSARRKLGSPKHDTPLYIEMEPMHPVAFSIYVLNKTPNHKWRKKKVTFFCGEEKLCDTWVVKIKETLSDKRFNRPRSLLVFVNPFGGRRKAPSIYDCQIAPLFELAEIQTHVIKTTHANHAKEILAHYNLRTVDGVVCVGGDGMFTELLNGLLDRRQREAGILQTPQHSPLPPNLRIGIIPAGSTDAIVYTTTGINDPKTSALHIILGDSIGIDVCSIYSGQEFLRYSCSMLSYGYYGDMLKDSESNRWMGPSRYQLAGAKKFLGNRAYEGEVSFRLSSNTETNPKDKVFCVSGCNVCSFSKEKTDQQDSHSTDSITEISHDADGWHRFRGKFLAVASFTMSCRCKLAPIGPSPFCHLGDGTSDIMVVQHCSRIQFLRHLYRCSGTKANQFDFPFIKVFRVKEWSFKATEQKEEMSQSSPGKQNKSRECRTSVWNCDGEVLEQPNLNVRVHCQLVNLFARGIEDFDQERNFSSCCSLCE